MTDHKRSVYPYQVVCGREPSPTVVHAYLPDVDFIRTPTTSDYVVWGFKTMKGLRRFRAHFGEHITKDKYHG